MAELDDDRWGGVVRRLPTRLPLPLLLALWAALLFAGGCADEPDGATSPPRVLSVAEAADATGEVAVEGHLFLVLVPERPARLCRGLSESFPPACVEPSLRVEGLSGELPQLEATSNGTHLWSSAPLVVRGTATGAGAIRLSNAPWGVTP